MSGPGTAALVKALDAARDRVELAAAFAETRAGVDTLAELDVALGDLATYQQRAATLVQIKREALTYTPDSQASFFRDLLATRSGVDPAAAERLKRHAREVADLATLERRDIASSALNGIVPPQFVVDAFQAGVRARRVVADVISVPLGDAGMSITVPAATTAMTAASQTAQNAALTASDPAVTDRTATVQTIAASVQASRQVVERGSGDILVALELGGALGAEVERQVINGSGTNGELTGYLNAAGTNAVTYTSASPTAAELSNKLAALLTSSAGTTLPDPDFLVMHARRWAYFASRTESTFAQVITPPAPGDPTGTVARVLGVPVLLSGGVPTTLSTNQDAIIAAHAGDLMLFESPPALTIIENVGPAAFRITLHEYAALVPRLAAGVAKMNGTGLAAVAS